MEAERNAANIKRFKSGPRLGRKSIAEVREEVIYLYKMLSYTIL